MKRLLYFVLFLTLASGVFAQQKIRILFVLDASGSMWARMENGSRIDVAKRLLTNMVDSLSNFDHVEIALRVYGHQSNKTMQDCKDSRLEVPFEKNNHLQIKNKLKNVVPKGTTLIAYSLQQAAYDFPTKTDVKYKNVIILITDGLEECSGDPCAVSEALQKQGVALKPFIIGVGGNEDFVKQFECVGRYFNASTEEDFGNVLNSVITQALNNTTVQVNLLDINGRATETNSNMTFYDSKTGKMVYNWVHTLNDRGVPDTITLDPSLKYDIVVHTVPPVRKNNIEIIPARHNIIAIDAPQGEIEVKMVGVTVYQKLYARVIKHGDDSHTVTHQVFNSKQKYIIGKYDLEIFTTPRIYFENVDVSQSKVTTIELMQPGKLAIFSSKDYIGAIYQYRQGKLEWVCDTDGRARQQIVYMQPGQYKLVGRPLYQNSTLMTFERNFEINSAGSTNINLN